MYFLLISDPVSSGILVFSQGIVDDAMSREKKSQRECFFLVQQTLHLWTQIVLDSKFDN
jgi:hypothetical protein